MHICSACHRHVKSAPCPFCGAEQTAPTAAAVVSSRLSRGQLLASAALLGALVPGCARTETAAPAYGAPPATVDSGPVKAPEPSESTVAAIYGAPPPPDEPAADAGVKPPPPNHSQPHPNVAPAYGGPPGTR